MKNLKKLLRGKCKDIRCSLDIESISESICSFILDSSMYQHSKNIMLFYPLVNEVSLLRLLSDTSKNFYFPVVDGDVMVPVKYDNKFGFQKGVFNILEPVGEKLLDYSILDIIIVPALTVDKQGFRLGYGRGYYDKFLNQCEDVTTLVPIPDELVFEEIPLEKHDVPIMHIVTQSGFRN